MDFKQDSDNYFAGLDDYIKKSFQIIPEIIQEEFVRVPADLAYWNHQVGEAAESLAMAKLDEDRTEAQLWNEHRDALIAAGVVKPTEKQIDSAVECDARMYDAHKRRIAAEAHNKRMSGYADAVRVKKDMLVSIGAHQRAEMEGDPAVRNRTRASHQYG